MTATPPIPGISSTPCPGNDTITWTDTGQGRPLVCVHGWAMHGGVWAGLARGLSCCCRVITVDLRGHGSSQHMSGPYTFDTFARDVVHLIEGLGLADVTVVGWSMGVSTLLRLLSLTSCPAVSSCVFISGSPSLISRNDYAHGVTPVTVRRLQRAVSRNYPGGLRLFHELLFTREEREHAQNRHEVRQVCDLGSAPTREAALESLDCLATADLRPDLGSIGDRPVLLVHGSRDRVCMPDAAVDMQARLTRARLMLLAGAGHAPFVSYRDRVVKTILEFLDDAH